MGSHPWVPRYSDVTALSCLEPKISSCIPLYQPGFKKRNPSPISVHPKIVRLIENQTKSISFGDHEGPSTYPMRSVKSP